MDKFREYIPSPQSGRNIYSDNGNPLAFVKKFPIEKLKLKELANPQKEIDYDKVSYMLSNFDQNLWEPVLIDTEYYLLDGRHRIEIAKLVRLRYIDVIIENGSDHVSVINNKEEKKISNDLGIFELA